MEQQNFGLDAFSMDLVSVQDLNSSQPLQECSEDSIFLSSKQLQDDSEHNLEEPASKPSYWIDACEDIGDFIDWDQPLDQTKESLESLDIFGVPGYQSGGFVTDILSVDHLQNEENTHFPDPNDNIIGSDPFEQSIEEELGLDHLDIQHFSPITDGDCNITVADSMLGSLKKGDHLQSTQFGSTHELEKTEVKESMAGKEMGGHDHIKQQINLHTENNKNDKDSMILVEKTKTHFDKISNECTRKETLKEKTRHEFGNDSTEFGKIHEESREKILSLRDRTRRHDDRVYMSMRRPEERGNRGEHMGRTQERTRGNGYSTRIRERSRSIDGAADRDDRKKRLRESSRDDRQETRHWDLPRERGRFDRKRDREWERESERRDRDRSRRERETERRDRDGRKDRERRGYWERDRSGKMVFRHGTWDAETERERARQKETEACLRQCKSSEKVSDEPKEKPAEERARNYQLEVLEQARVKNTIAFLETGAGKTLIAVLLMRSVCRDMRKENRKMLAIFLVPKVPLVYQQAEVIRKQTGYNVGHYCGEMGQDFWDSRRWQREFESKEVLVMTAQILLNILRHSIIKMESINLLILDECHHAVKKHPYSLVMSEFYHTTAKDKRPAVFGMTASPVNMKGVSNQEDCAIKIRNLESKLDSIVCTIKDRKELEKHVPMPLEVVVVYDKAAILWSLHEQIKLMEAAVENAAHASSKRSKWQFMGARDAGAKEELRLVYGVSERTESDGAANLMQKLRAINYALDELGQWCAYKVAQSFLTALQNDERANHQLDVKFQESYLKKVVALLQCQLTEGAVCNNKDTFESEDKNNASGGTSGEVEEGELLGTQGE